MDVDDSFVASRGTPRTMACDCDVDPAAPTEGAGCACPSCGARCEECSGFGWAVPPVRKFHQILASIRSQIARRTNVSGHPPCFLRLPAGEIEVVERKYRAESDGHWVREDVTLGPPLRIYDVPIVRDRRRGR